MYPAARTHTYLWVSGYTFTFLRASGSERGDQKKEKDKDHRREGPWRAGKESCETAGPNGHAEAGGSKEEPVK